MSEGSAETIAVVGGASGLGAATVRAFHAAGFRVGVLDLDGGRARALADELGEVSFAVTVDVTDDAGVATAIERCCAVGPLRGVVCCAGIGWAERLLGRDGAHAAESFDRVLAVNVGGSFRVLRHAARVIAGNDPGEHGDRGFCLLTASIAAEDGQAGQAAYAASKAAIAGLVLPAARDLAPSSIRVCGIAPGVFATPLLEGLPKKAREELEQLVPSPPRFGDPVEFASLALEVERNPYLNGSVLRLDGALRMPYQPPREGGARG